jgi:Ca2+-binding EF-hand superfamily protein
MDFDAFVVLLGYKTIELDPEEDLIEAMSVWDPEGTGLLCEEE